jgi:hypothetical protein
MAELALDNEKILADIKKTLTDMKGYTDDTERFPAAVEVLSKIYQPKDKLYTKPIDQYDYSNTPKLKTPNSLTIGKECISPKMKYFDSGIYANTNKYLTDDRKEFPTMSKYKHVCSEKKYFDAGFYPDIKDGVKYKYFEAGIYKMNNISDKIPIIYNYPMMSHVLAYFEAGYYPVDEPTNLKKYRNEYDVDANIIL